RFRARSRAPAHAREVRRPVVGRVACGAFSRTSPDARLSLPLAQGRATTSPISSATPLAPTATAGAVACRSPGCGIALPLLEMRAPTTTRVAVDSRVAGYSAWL